MATSLAMASSLLRAILEPEETFKEFYKKKYFI